MASGRVICAIFAIARLLTAQQPIVTDPGVLLHADAEKRAKWAAEWLSSSDPRLIAWGAWLARQDHLTALIPLLVDKIAKCPAAPELELNDAVLAVLDAAIALDAPAPVEDAHRLYSGFPAQSLILLIHSQADAQPALLDIFQRAKANWNWLAAGNVLLKARAPGFAALLLNRYTQHLTVSVVDSNMGSGAGGGGSECGFSLRAPKLGWPVVGLYHLTQFPERLAGVQATFLAGGDTPVYYWRVAPGNYDNPRDERGYCDDGNRDEYRAQYLGDLLRHSFLDPYLSTGIDWHGESDYKERLHALLMAQREKFQDALMSLQQSGRVLTETESTALKLRIELIIRDDRRDRSRPIPPVEEGVTVVRTTFSKPLD